MSERTAEGFRKVRPTVVGSPEDFARLQHLKKVAYVMDDLVAIPGLRYRVGLDGMIGLVPGVGDMIGFLISNYFIFTAAQMKVSKTVLTRMFVNVLIDSALGLVPFAGDAFDFVWKANRKNLALLEKHLADPPKLKRRSAGFLILLAVAVIALAGLIGWGAIKILEALVHL